MEYRRLGRTGVEVSPLCLGTLAFGARGNADHGEVTRMVHHALDAGINFVDSADVYSHGESEEILGRALTGRRDQVVLATKFGNRMAESPNSGGNSRRWILQEIDASLRRLRTDWIDLYLVHRPDPGCDIDETLGALSDLVRNGKVRYIGCSKFRAHEIVESQWVSERRRRERFTCEQPPYSLLARGIEHEVLPICERYGMGVMTWSPLATGWLSGEYRAGRELPASVRALAVPDRFDMSLEQNRRKLEAVEQLHRLAQDAGLTMVELALGFIGEHPAVSAAIIGPRTMSHLEAYLDAAETRLEEWVLDRIDEIVPPGMNLNPADAGDAPQPTTESRRRSRTLVETKE